MKKSTGKTARIVSAVISMILTVSLIIPPVYAAESNTGDNAGSEAAAVRGASGKTTLGDMIKNKGTGSAAGEKDPLEGTVVVLMEDSSLGTETKVKKTLSSGEGAVQDINVEEVWTFDAADEEDKQTSMLKLSSADGESSDGSKSGTGAESSDEYTPAEDAVVALVSSDSISPDRLVRKLNARKDVKLAEKNVKVHSLSVTSDKYIDSQWSMQDNELSPHVEYMWNDKEIKGSEKIVAVVDTGVDYKHPDLKDNMWVNTHRKLKGKYGYDFINGTPDPMDDNGHGSHCAGIIGGVGDNGEGISGVNQNIKIMALKTLDYEGSAWLSHEVAAYNYINMALDLGEPVVAINNSWGGGDDSGILIKLIDIVGEKGAVTVAAAGNDGTSNDDYPQYPSNLDSPYLISVAATGRDGKLAWFSNYGESVDVAAPGEEILSTVCYESYNPSIYGDEQDSISEEYHDFENDDFEGEDKKLIPHEYYLNGKSYEGTGEITGEEGREYTCDGGQTIKVKKVDSGFGDSGNSLELTFSKMEAGDLACFVVPYSLLEPGKNKPAISMMLSTSTKVQMDFFGGPIFGIANAPAGTDLDLDTVGNLDITGLYVMGDFDGWDHVSFSDDSDEDSENDREFIVFMYASDDGDYKIRLDDIGLSKQGDNIDFGKYDFMSGTSMATPFMSGAVALKIAEKIKNAQDAAGDSSGAANTGYDVTEVISEICAMSKDMPVGEDGDNKVIAAGGTFDFKKVPDVLPPRIGKVTVDVDAGTILIEGTGLDHTQAGFKVELGESLQDEDMKEAEVLSSDGKSITIKNDGWINNVENIRITGAGGKKSQKKNVYLVNGKKEYKAENDLALSLSSEAFTTDGKKIYNVWSSSGDICSYKISSKEVYDDTIATVNPDKLFKIKKQENAKYGMLFGKDLVYSNKKLYNVLEYGQIDEIESSDDDFIIFGKSTATDDDDDDDDGDDGIDGEYSIYAGEYRLISVDTTTGPENRKTVKSLGELPDDLADLDGFTMTAYNGKLYFIGGCSGYDEDKVYSDKVFIYDPKKAKWSEGASLPSPRAYGKALQYNNMLIYTLGSDSVAGEDSSTYPDNLIFDGKTWKACGLADRLELIGSGESLNVSLTAKGLLYTGAPFAGLGDTFIYDVKANDFTDTGYNYLKEPFDSSLKAVAVGKKVYGVSDNGTYSMPVASGLKAVTASKKGKGKVSGTGNYMPGNDVKITVKASKKYYIKSLKVGSKKISLKKGATKKTYTIKAITANKKIKVVFAKKKAKKKK